MGRSLHNSIQKSSETFKFVTLCNVTVGQSDTGRRPWRAHKEIEVLEGMSYVISQIISKIIAIIAYQLLRVVGDRDDEK